jgi:hypothetical protein
MAGFAHGFMPWPSPTFEAHVQPLAKEYHPKEIQSKIYFTRDMIRNHFTEN